MFRRDTRDALDKPCPRCGAGVGASCEGTVRGQVHPEREEGFARQRERRRVVCWTCDNPRGGSWKADLSCIRLYIVRSVCGDCRTRLAMVRAGMKGMSTREWIKNARRSFASKQRPFAALRAGRK